MSDVNLSHGDAGDELARRYIETRQALLNADPSDQHEYARVARAFVHAQREFASWAAFDRMPEAFIGGFPSNGALASEAA